MARTKKCEIWVHFPETSNVKMRHFETCKSEEEANHIITIQKINNRSDEKQGYAPLGLSYTIEPYGTLKALGQIVYR